MMLNITAIPERKSMENRKIDPQKLARDILRGMDHDQLMEKYGVCSETLHGLYEEVAAAGLIDKSLVPNVIFSRAEARSGGWTCPNCGISQTEEFDECPVCGIGVSKFGKGPAASQRNSSDPNTSFVLFSHTSADDGADHRTDNEADTNERTGRESEGIVGHMVDWISEKVSGVSDVISELSSKSNDCISEGLKSEAEPSDSSSGNDSGSDSDSNDGGGDGGDDCGGDSGGD
jgi:hypothetical protein